MTDERLFAFIVVWLTLALAVALLWWSNEAHARWKSEYGATPPEIQQWFKSQHNEAGQWCCDESDGHRYEGDYTLNADGSVTLHDAVDDATGKPRVLPPSMVLKGTNPTGSAIWWYGEGDGWHHDYCFAPGAGA